MHKVSSNNSNGVVRTIIPSHKPHPAERAVELIGIINEEEQLQMVADIVCKLADSHYGVNIAPDFLQLTLSASQNVTKAMLCTG